MRNYNPRIVKIVNPGSQLRFQCKVCGQIWGPSYCTGGRLKKGSWHCPNGCKA